MALQTYYQQQLNIFCVNAISQIFKPYLISRVGGGGGGNTIRKENDAQHKDFHNSDGFRTSGHSVRPPSMSATNSKNTFKKI